MESTADPGLCYACTAKDLTAGHLQADHQVANIGLLRAQVNSASYPQRDGNWVPSLRASGRRSSVADWGGGMSVGCIARPNVYQQM